MNFVRHQKIWAIFVALMMLFAALAPSISHALLAQKIGADWGEICTAQGSRWVKTDTATDTKTVNHAYGSVKHCPYCASDLPALFVAPKISVVHYFSSVQTVKLPHPYESSAIWQVSLARAPPQFS